ncbi:hypothetical protein Nepgr_024914 [Nepenthes gracilis]|uniref:Uncharacterized protein n=1 Tax=Nepenthes gracilis TaxID=150966 RepID=A0AAD3Y0Z1_NEPGR|nr:hypothetical protein Nepgr_024914 [Nepenthes gracilis]
MTPTIDGGGDECNSGNKLRKPEDGEGNKATDLVTLVVEVIGDIEKKLLEWEIGSDHRMLRVDSAAAGGWHRHPSWNEI